MLTWARAPQIGYTSLIMAAAFGRAPVVKLLLDAGANKNAKNNVRGRRGGVRRTVFAFLWVASRLLTVSMLTRVAAPSSNFNGRESI